MTIWLTTYALTEGILKGEAKDEQEFFVTLRSKDGVLSSCYTLPPHRHVRYQDAKNTAEGMRDQRIASLQKQIIRLRKLTFEEARSIEDPTKENNERES